jgi:hypothetical protein
MFLLKNLGSTLVFLGIIGAAYVLLILAFILSALTDK